MMCYYCCFAAQGQCGAALWCADPSCSLPWLCVDSMDNRMWDPCHIQASCAASESVSTCRNDHTAGTGMAVSQHSD